MDNLADINVALGEEADLPLNARDLAAIDAIVEAKVVAAEGRITAAMKSEFNTTMLVMLRRTIRNFLGTRRDPAGDPRTSPPSAYPDDTTPIT